jgi:hypothetical protein
VEEYLRNGAEYLNRIEGVYLIAVYDSLRDELSVMNDSFGSLPLNYYLNKNEIVFSSQLKSIQSLIPTSLNESAFAEHLSMGITLNGKTFLKNVHRLWPGTILKLKPDGFKIIPYFKAAYAVSDEGDINQKLKLTEDSFKTFIKENLDPELNIAAALSGGFDSRLIWSVVHNQKIAATATTFGQSDALDIEIAELITKTLNLSQEVLILTKRELQNFGDHAEELIKISEGFTNIESAILVPYYRWLKRKYNVLIDGTGSAIYRRQVFRRNSNLLRSKDELPKFIFTSHHVDGGKTDPDKQVFITKYKSEILANLEEYFAKFKDYGTIQDLIDIFYLHHYIGFRFSSDIMFQNQYIYSFHPFCNTSTYQHIRGYSVSERRKLLFHNYAINHFEPRLTAIPLVNSGVLVPFHGFKIRRIWPIGLAILKERYKVNFVPDRYKRFPVFNFEEAYRKDLFPFIENVMMDEKTRKRPFWSGRSIEENLHLYRDQHINYGRTITNIITSEFILRQFVDSS